MKKGRLNRLITDLRIDKSEMPFNAAAMHFARALLADLAEELQGLDWYVELPERRCKDLEKILSIEEGEK